MPERLNHMPSQGKLSKKAKGTAKVDEYQSMSLRSKIANMYLKGLSQYEIAEELGCSQPNISYHLKIIREQWLSSTVRDFDSMKAQELAKIDHLEAVAWDAFLRSQKDAKTTEKAAFRKKAQEGEEDVEEAEEELRVVKEQTREQAGDPRFLNQVAWCIDKRCKICKIDEGLPTNNNMFIINFDQLFGRPDDSDDPIERRIEQARVIEAVPTPPRPASSQNGSNGKRSKL